MCLIQYFLFTVYSTAADQVVSGDGQLERLVVASQGIMASTAQLVVASRVKAGRNSKNMTALSAASKDVTHATAGVVATAKACSQLIEENGNFYFYYKGLCPLLCLPGNFSWNRIK